MTDTDHTITVYAAIRVGCLECNMSTVVLGLFADAEAAQKVLDADRDGYTASDLDWDVYPVQVGVDLFGATP